MIRSIAITGTRKTSGISIWDMYRLVDDVLAPFNAEEMHWFVGGANGMDTYALRWFIKHAVGRVTIVVPWTLDQQPAEAKRYIRAAMGTERFDLVELQHPRFPAPEAYHARNHDMVDRSELVIGFPELHASSGGTVATLEYAERQGKPRLIRPVAARRTPEVSA